MQEQSPDSVVAIDERAVTETIDQTSVAGEPERHSASRFAKEMA